jgi:hypothetical protein
MAGFLIYLLCTLSFCTVITIVSSQEPAMPPHATIRLTLLYDAEADDLLTKDSMPLNLYLNRVSNAVQDYLHVAKIGLHLQLVKHDEIHVPKEINRSYDYLDNVTGVIEEKEYNPEFLIILSGRTFQHPSYHAEPGASLGFACQPKHRALVLMREIVSGKKLTVKQIARSMTAMLLFALKTSRQHAFCEGEDACCYCRGVPCIMDDHPANSTLIVKCSELVIAKSPPSCLKTEPDIKKSAIAVCGNGLLEAGEECDCFSNENNCKKKCKHCKKKVKKPKTTTTKQPPGSRPQKPGNNTTAKGTNSSIPTIGTSTETPHNGTTAHEDMLASEIIGIVSIIVIGVCVVAIPVVIYLLCKKNKNHKKK